MHLDFDLIELLFNSSSTPMILAVSTRLKRRVFEDWNPSTPTVHDFRSHYKVVKEEEEEV